MTFTITINGETRQMSVEHARDSVYCGGCGEWLTLMEWLSHNIDYLEWKVPA